MKFIVALLPLLLASGFDAAASDFTCPDELSRELFSTVRELNRLHPFTQAKSGYVRVIEQASRRPMDDLAHRLACASLARRIFRTNCMGYGYACPRPGDDVWKWPADINESIPALQANVPALRSCPEAYIREDSKLPIARAVPVLPSDVVDDKITGWVALRLDIDEFGKVANARVALSTSSRLEEPALEAVRRFRYQPELRNGRYVTLEDVSAVVYFHYWLLAEAAGCSISYE